MSCSPFDLRDYFLRELTDAERRQTEVHLKGCPECREEVERLRLTEAALLSLGDEEIPQRIGFVSDKVFEPSPLRRWWLGFWGSASRLGFASAAMLSVAILVSAFGRPAPAPASAVISQVDLAKLEARFTARMNQAVSQAVTETRAIQERKTADLLAAAEAAHQADRSKLILEVQEGISFMTKRVNVARYNAATDSGGDIR